MYVQVLKLNQLVDALYDAGGEFFEGKVVHRNNKDNTYDVQVDVFVFVQVCVSL